MAGGGPSDRALVLGIAATQFIGWGTLFVPFPLLLSPMEAELGWSRALINGAYTAGLLVGGIVAVPVGRWIDRHGARGVMSWTALAGAALLLGWSRVTAPWEFYLVWLGIGLAQAGCLWGPAMAVMVALARDPARSITAVTFITGVTSTAFLPLADALIGGLGWRGALVALGALQVAPGLVTLWLLRGAPRGPASPGAAGAAAGPAPPRLAAVIRSRAFAGLALCFAAHALVATGLGAHLIPLLRERGLAEGLVLTLAALHGPGQVAARAALYFGGARLGGVRGVGIFATTLLAMAMLALALAGRSLAVTLLFILCLAAADGLLTIVRATGVMEILGRAGYGAITGALSAMTVLPRTLAPLALALIWQEAGGYGPVPWLLLAVAAAGCAAFLVAARATPAEAAGGGR